MTVSNTTRRTSAVGAGAILAVSYSFPTSASGDLTVIQRVTTTGVETELAETSGYTATYGSTGGTVTTVASIAATDEIHVIRNTPMTQTLDLEQGGAFNAENVEAALDKNTKLIIENADVGARSLTVPDTDDSSIDLELPSTVDRADKFMTFDSSGNATATAALDVGVVTFGAFGETMAATASASAANTALGMTAFFKTLLNDSTATIFLATLGLTVSPFGKTIIDDAAATNVLTTLGFSAFIKTLIDDTTAAATRVTLGAMTPTDIVCYDNRVVCYKNRMVTKYNYA
ncbi:MAG: hypothetical protein KAV00_10280 [Phycisphaerae bacterium]|nr:hypothetical protein [Phycisphaerae bacterium]